VLLAGFQAEGTHGRELEEGAKSIQIHGEVVPVRAEVVNLRQFSAHAGRSELMRWLAGIPAPPRQLFLVHGEPVAAQALKSAVQAQLHWPVTVPNYLQSFDLAMGSASRTAACGLSFRRKRLRDSPAAASRELPAGEGRLET